MSQVRKLGLFSLEKRGFGGDLIYTSREGAKKIGNRLLSVVPKDGRQWTQNETQEIPFKHKKKLLHSEGYQILEEIVQRV